MRTTRPRAEAIIRWGERTVGEPYAADDRAVLDGDLTIRIKSEDEDEIDTLERGDLGGQPADQIVPAVHDLLSQHGYQVVADTDSYARVGDRIETTWTVEKE